jgi:hypothetical protein
VSVVLNVPAAPPQKAPRLFDPATAVTPVTEYVRELLEFKKFPVGTVCGV